MYKHNANLSLVLTCPVFLNQIKIKINLYDLNSKLNINNGDF